jgi:hypothetical protein
MLSHEDKIRLIHQYRTGLLDHIFDELCRKSGSGADQMSDAIIATAESIQNALSRSDGIGSPARRPQTRRTGKTLVEILWHITLENLIIQLRRFLTWRRGL